MSTIASYINHEGKWFMISTIERDCSSPYNATRYNEILAWEYDRETTERGKQIYSGEDNRGSLTTHNGVCKSLYESGRLPEF